MEIADNIGARLTCGAKTAVSDTKPASDDDEDIVEPDIDVGTYDDIVDESELKMESDIKPFRGFMIDQLLANK